MDLMYGEPWPLIILTDRGDVFISLTWINVFQKNPNLLGSMSLPGKPGGNSVIENFYLLFKHKISHLGKLQPVYKTKKAFLNDFYKRVHKFNTVRTTRRSFGLTP